MITTIIIGISPYSTRVGTAFVPTPPSTGLLTENDNFILAESGYYLIQE